MRPHPRIRKTVKWGGAVVCSLFLVLGIISGKYFIYAVAWRGWSVGFAFGGCNIAHVAQVDMPMIGPSFVPRSRPFKLCWCFDKWAVSWSGTPNMQGTNWTVPLWAPLLIAAILTLIPWHLDTLARGRAKLGACPKCSYFRTGLAPSAVCPECGSPAPGAARPG